MADDIEVRFRGDISGLTAAAGQAAGVVRAATAQITGSASSFTDYGARLTAGMSQAGQAAEQMRQSFYNAGLGMRRTGQEAVEMGGQVRSAATESISILSRMREVVGALGLAFGAIKVAEFAKDTIQLAARYQELGVVVNRLGGAAGYTTQQMAGFEGELTKTGISMVESRQSMLRLIQGHIDLAQATQLARLAQDTAVVGMVNSSEAFQRLTYGIVSGQIEVLRTIGLNVNFEDSYKRLAAELHKTQASLTPLEKMQARVNEAFRAGKTVAGAYEAAMETAGKQMRSTTRYLEDMQVKVGEAFLPVYSAAVRTYADVLHVLADNVQVVTSVVAGLSAALVARLVPALIGATVAGRGLMVALGFFGGPIGIAIAAVTAGITYLGLRTSEAADHQQTMNDRLDNARALAVKLAAATSEQRVELEKQRQQLIDNARAEIAVAQAALLRARAEAEANAQTKVNLAQPALQQQTFTGLTDEQKEQALMELRSRMAGGAPVTGAPAAPIARTARDLQAASDSAKASALALSPAVQEAEDNVTTLQEQLAQLSEVLNDVATSTGTVETASKKTQSVLKSLREEIARMLSPAGIQREIVENLQKAGVSAGSGAGQQIIALTTQLERLKLAEDAANESFQRGQQIAEREDEAKRAASERAQALIQSRDQLVASLAREQQDQDALTAALREGTVAYEVEVRYQQIANQFRALGRPLLGQEVQHYRQLAAQMVATEHEVQRLQQSSFSIFQTIRNAFSGMLQGMLQGTQTWQEVVRNLFTNLLAAIINAKIDELVVWVSTEQAKTAATVAGATTRAAAESTADAAGEGGIAARIGKALKAIMADAAQVYADVFAYLSGVMGPLAAIPAGAAAALVLGARVLLPSLDVGTWNVPSDMVAKIHKGEMVVPAPFAPSMRRALAGGGSGGDTFHVHTVDKRGIERLLRNNGPTLAKVVREQTRAFNPAVTTR